MPSRIIKESITTSESLAQVTGDAERLFWRLVVLADDYGLYDGRPLTILGKGMTAFLGRVKEKDIEGWLKDLEKAGLCRRYIVDNKPYLQLPSWAKHQQKRAAKSKYPAPEPNCAQSPELLASDSDGNQEPVNVLVNENVNVFVNENVLRAANAPLPTPDPVLEVFEHYQARVQPNARLIDAARQKIKTRLKTYSVAELRECVDRFAADDWRMENNARMGAAWFFHSDERTEKFLALMPRASPNNGRVVERIGPELRTVEEVLRHD